MKKNILGRVNSALLIGLMAVSIFATHCTKPTTIGGDLVNENELNFGTVDTLPLKMTTVESTDSLKSFVFSSLPFALSRYYLGQLEDPVLGSNTCEIIAQYGPYPGSYAQKFVDATVDSVYLTLILDSAGYYGDKTAMHSLAVARLSEPMQMDTTFYTFQDFATEATLLGEKTDFVANLEKRFLVVTPDSSVVDSNSAYIRIPLDVNLGQEVLSMDSVDYADAEKFAEKFKGIKIFSTTPSAGMLGVLLSGQYSEIDIYYHTPTEDSLVFPIHPLRGYTASNRQVQDYTGAFVEQHIGVENDSLFFMQSTGGLNLEVELPDITTLGDVIVNKAILEFTLESLSFDDTTTFKVLNQLVMKDTTDAFIIDINQILAISGNMDIFGGSPKFVTRDGETRMVVQMNISTLLQEVAYGRVDNKIVIKPSPEITNLGRLVIQGFKGDKKWQPKLYLNYTELN